MKNRNLIIALIVFVFSSFGAVAQELTVPSATSIPSINGSVATNVLYIGIDNSISITGSGYDAASITASISGPATLSAVEAGKSYIARVTEKGEVTITLTIADGTERFVVNKTFKVMSIPLPYAALGTIKNGDFTDVETFKKNAVELLARYDGPEIEGVNYKILSAVFIFVPKQGEARIVSLTDAKLTAECITMLEGIGPGDRVVFDQIRAEGLYGKRNLAPVVITLR